MKIGEKLKKDAEVVLFITTCNKRERKCELSENSAAIDACSYTTVYNLLKKIKMPCKYTNRLLVTYIQTCES